MRASVNIDVAHFLIAYSAAVAVAASFFGLQIGIATWIAGGASTVPMPDRLFQTVLVCLLLALLFAFCAFWMALVPAVISIVLARRLGIESVFYYVTCGAVSAILLAPVTTWLLPYDDLSDFPPTFAERCIRTAFILIVPAAIGAVAFWFLDRRLRVRSLLSDDDIR